MRCESIYFELGGRWRGVTYTSVSWYTKLTEVILSVCNGLITILAWGRVADYKTRL